MAESNTSTLLARAEYLAYSHDRPPAHTRPQAYSSVVEAFGEIPPSPAEAEIKQRLDAYQELLDDDIPTPLELTESVDPSKLAAEIKKASSRYVLRSYLKTGQDVVSTLGHKLRGVRWSAEGYAHTVAHLRDQLDELESELLESADKLGDKLLADTELAIEANSAAVGQFGNAAAKLTALTRIVVRDRERESRDRVAIVVRPLFDTPTPLRIKMESDGEVVLSSPEEVRRHEDSKLLLQLWKRGSGVALAAVAVGVLPSFEVAVADDWDEVARRYDIITRSAAREVEAKQSGSITVSTKGDTVTPAPNWEY